MDWRLPTELPYDGNWFGKPALRKKLLNAALAASSMINGASSYDDFLASELNETKRHEGQIKTADFMREWLKDSQMLQHVRMNFTTEPKKTF